MLSEGFLQVNKRHMFIGLYYMMHDVEKRRNGKAKSSMCIRVVLSEHSLFRRHILQYPLI